MATKILDIDIDSIIKKSTTLKAELDSLRKQQAKMKKDNDTSSESYVKLEARIKNISSEYGKNQTQLANLNKVGGDFLTVNQKIATSLAEEVNSIEEARKNVSELTKLRNQLNLNDKEQLKLAEELNKKIDQNNEFIKENVSQLEKQKIGIGDYASGIRDAIGDTGLLGGELKTLTGVLESFKLPLEELKTGFTDGFNQIKNATAETEGLTKAQKAQAVATNVGTGALKVMKLVLASLGIGLIIAAVVLLIGYLRTFDPLMDKLEQGFSAVGAVIEVVAKVIFDFVRGLTDVGATIQKVGNFLKNPIKAFKELGKEMKEAAEAAIALKKAQQDLEDQTILQEIANAKASQQVKELMLQSKNLQLTEEQRIELLQKANKIEQENYNQRAKLAEDELDIARRVITTKAGITEEDIRRLAKEGTAYAIALKDRLNVSDDEVKALQQAEIAKIKILEESTAIREKIQNQTDSLEEKRRAAEEKRIKDIEDARSKAVERSLARSKAEIDLFIAQQGFKARSLQEELILEQTITAKRLELLEKEFRAGKKIKEEYEAEKLNIQNEYLRKQAELAVDYARRRLDEELKNIPEVLSNEKFLTDLMVQEEQRRLDLIKQKRENFEAYRLEQGIIDEQQYQDAITAIQEETQKKRDEVALKRLEAEKEKQAIDLENQRAYEDLVFRENLEIQLARLELQRQKEIEAAEKTGASIDLINRKYAAAKNALENQSRISQIENARIAIQDINALLTGFFGENKLLSAALASTDMFLAAQKAYLSQLVPGDPTSIVRAQFAAFKAGAFGALNIARILAVKYEDGGIPDQLGGILKGPSHAHGGIPTPFGEMEGKEAIINKRSTEMFKPLLSAINVAGGGRKFAKGYIPGATTAASLLNSLNMNKSDGIDYDLLASKVAEANMSLPPNKLSIEEFNLYQARFNEVVKGASFE